MAEETSSQVDRRACLKALLAGGAISVFPFANRASALAGTLSGTPVFADGSGPLWLLQPLSLGDEVAFGWRVAGLSDVRRGAAVLTLAHENGSEARVHLCSRGTKPRGIASTDHLDFVLMNGSQGQAPSDEQLGRVILTVASRVRANERAMTREFSAAAALLPHEDRVRLFGAETLV